MTRTFFHIDIPKRAQRCAKGAELFTPGTDYYSLLIEQKEGYRREDYCLPCWEKIKEETALSPASSWRSQAAAAKKEDPPKEGDEKILDLFRHYLQKDTEEGQMTAFILALYLARKKRLFFKKEWKKETGEFFYLYELPQTEEAFCLKKWEFSSLSLEKIRENIALFLPLSSTEGKKKQKLS